MNSLNLTYLGGAPVTQADLKWMQDSYGSALAALAAFIGDKVIIAGMAELGNGSITDGWISLNGELIPFMGGIAGAGEFIVEETVNNRTFKDGTVRGVRINRAARFSAGGNYNYADLKRMGTLKNSVMPKGGIIMWSGAIANIPAGWALCNGQNGTPNLTDRFIVGAGNDYGVGGIGGEATHTLLANEMPSHSHMNGICDDKPAGHGQNVFVYGQTASGMPGQAHGNVQNSDGGTAYQGYTSTAGGGQPHNNLPPYYALAFIVKL